MAFWTTGRRDHAMPPAKKRAGATGETSASFCPMNAANRTFQQIITTIAPMVG